MVAHLNDYDVRPGQKVVRGEVIGEVGNTGKSTGPHLHYEIIKDGVHVNPMTVKLPAISNLGKADKKKFLEYRKTLDQGIGRLQRHPSMFIQL